MLKFLLTQEHLNSARWKNDTDAISVFCQKTGFIFLPDRFGFLNQFSNWNFAKWDTPFPNTGSTLSLYDIILQRATELYYIAKRNSKDIYILWSGGVDSTTIVTAFFQIMGISDRLHILYTESSIKEFPEFYSMMSKRKDIELHHIEFDTIEEVIVSIEGKGYIITGFPADQLFGSIINQRLPIPYNSDWREFIQIDNAISQFESAFAHYGLPVYTINQFTWFINFACKWELVKRMFSAEFGIVSDSIINFFDNESFQDWSVSNFDKLHIYPQTDPQYYKYELKSFIHKFFPCVSYFTKKGKLGSIAYACSISPINKPRIPKVAYLDSTDKVRVLTYSDWSTPENYLEGKRALVYNLLRKNRKP